MKNRISLSGVTNDVRHLGPVHRLLTVFVGACATVLLLAAGSPPLQAQDYTPLEGLRVSDGRVQFLFASAGQCIVLSNSSINGVVYTTHTSKWQRRAGSTWVDIPGTERDGLCSYSPTSPGEYRLVGEISIDGERGYYSSENTLTVEGVVSELLTTLYFPDYVDGGEWSVQLAVSNIDTTAAAAVVVTAYDQEGQPIPGFFDSEATFEIPALGNRVLRSTGVGETRRGWIEVGTDAASVNGLLTYRNAATGLEVSVEPVELGSHFALFVEESSGIGTGLAIFKPDPASTIEFRIRDEDGINPLGEGFVTHPVGGETFQQRVGSIPEWFDVDGIDTEFLNDFRGLLFLRTEDGSSFAPLGIRFGRQGESLSSVPVVQVTRVPESPAQLAPADEAAFNELVVGKRVLSPHPAYYADFVSPGRFRETQGSDTFPGSYTYRNTGPNTGTLTFNYDDGDRCTASLTFASATTGTAASTCDDGSSAEYNWRLVEIPSDGG